MTPRQEVRAKYPLAVAVLRMRGGHSIAYFYAIKTSGKLLAEIIGEGYTTKAAWINAKENLNG